jgi:hypothetical protein
LFVFSRVVDFVFSAFLSLQPQHEVHLNSTTFSFCILASSKRLNALCNVAQVRAKPHKLNVALALYVIGGSLSAGRVLPFDSTRGMHVHAQLLF